MKRKKLGIGKPQPKIGVTESAHFSHFVPQALPLRAGSQTYTHGIACLLQVGARVQQRQSANKSEWAG